MDEDLGDDFEQALEEELAGEGDEETPEGSKAEDTLD